MNAPDTVANRTTSRRRFIKNTGTAVGGAALSMTCLSSVAGQESQPAQFDYIVVGAGTAGCVVASRLSEGEEARVLLLEAGGIDSQPQIHDPRKWSELLGSEVDWEYSTEKEDFLNQRQILWPRGKVLGGSSSINAMIYIRGHRLDFDHWHELGNEGWSYDDVLPYFIKSENNSRGKSKFHGVGGPLNVMDHPEPCEFVSAMIESATLAGYGGDTKWDFNGAQQENVAGSYQFTIKGRQRHSTAVAFLKPAMRRANLTVQTNSHVTRLLSRGSRITGVEVTTNGMTRTATAAREVIVCAGAINSPQLLMLSGIGPAEHLKRHGIRPAADRPGVGQNLQDHPSIWLMHRSKVETPADHVVAVDGGLFVRSANRPLTASPDLQFMGIQLDGRIEERELAGTPLWEIGVTLTQPKSRGSLRLSESNSLTPPLIKANYLAVEDDRKTLLFGLKLARKLSRQRPLIALSEGEVAPGTDVRTDRDMREYLRDKVNTTFHPVGTCKMGHDPMAVVDARLRVHGVSRLRVADASIMPVVTNGNTNAPTIMIAERSADMIKEDNG